MLHQHFANVAKHLNFKETSLFFGFPISTLNSEIPKYSPNTDSDLHS